VLNITCLVDLKACVLKLCVLLYSAVRGSLFGVCHCNELRCVNLISIKAIIIIIIIKVTNSGIQYSIFNRFNILFNIIIIQLPIGLPL